MRINQVFNIYTIEGLSCGEILLMERACEIKTIDYDRRIGAKIKKKKP